MVTNARKTPSYLTIRNGIYYFQFRIPEHLQNQNRTIPESGIVRKSTKTGNYREALRISRHWWNLIMVDKFFENKYPELVIAEKEIAKHEARVSRGRAIITQIKNMGINENDTYAMDSFFELYSLQDMKCYAAAKEYLEEINNPKEEVV